MALISGGSDAAAGMSKTIYDKINFVMADDIADLKAEEQEPIRRNWKKLSYAVAKGVIEHLKSNMEITGIRTSGALNTQVRGDTETGLTGGNLHHHYVDLHGVQTVEFEQSNDGTGHVV